jgi:hypothetical protein
MGGAARRLIHALKYQHYRSAAPAMAAFMPALAADLAVDRFFAVPLHRSRVRERGFNQSSLLLGHAGWVPSPGLERVRKTQRGRVCPRAEGRRCAGRLGHRVRPGELPPADKRAHRRLIRPANGVWWAPGASFIASLHP